MCCVSFTCIIFHSPLISSHKPPHACHVFPNTILCGLLCDSTSPCVSVLFAESCRFPIHSPPMICAHANPLTPTPPLPPPPPRVYPLAPTRPHRYCEGIKNSTRVLLREWHTLRLAAPEDGGFDAPRVMVATRMPGANNATRQSWLADEVFSMHEAFPDGMATIDDDSKNASKPALLTFFNPDSSWLQHGPQVSE